MRTLFIRIAAAIASATIISMAHAQPANEFYRGKQITVIVASDAGSGYDSYARLLTRHMGRHIPGNPIFIVQNLAAGGGMVMSNQVANIAPKDGTVIGASQASAAFERLLHLLSPDGEVARFDARKLNWLGTISQEVNVLIAWHGAAATTIDEMKTKEFVDGAAGPNTDGAIAVTMMNQMLGTKIKLVTGYAGAPAEFLALERGEIDGAALNFGSALLLHPDIVTNKNYKIVLQMGAAPHRDLKHVPFLTDLATNKNDHDLLELIFAKFMMGKPYFVAEGVPADRVALLRTAFNETLADPEFLADAKKSNLEISPVDAAGVQALIDRLYSEPEELVNRARQVLHPK